MLCIDTSAINKKLSIIISAYIYINTFIAVCGYKQILSTEPIMFTGINKKKKK